MNLKLFRRMPPSQKLAEQHARAARALHAQAIVDLKAMRDQYHTLLTSLGHRHDNHKQDWRRRKQALNLAIQTMEETQQ